MSGGQLLVFVYGQKFLGNEVIVSILAINILALALGMGIENGLTALHRPDLICWSNIIGLLTTLAISVPGILHYGVVGAAWGAVIGTIASTSTKLLLFVSAFRRELTCT